MSQNLPHPPVPSRAFRHCITRGAESCAVFAVDISSQPQYQDWSPKEPLLHKKTARAIAFAGPNDIVVVPHTSDKSYREWLKSLNLGPAEVVEYGIENPTSTLAEIIRANPKPVEEAIARAGKKPVYVPFYCSQREITVCRERGWPVFGCEEEITLPFFDKKKFKYICQQLHIPVVPGEMVSTGKRLLSSDPASLEKLLLSLLSRYPSIVVRGTLGAAGKSVYRVSAENLAEEVPHILEDKSNEFLLEPFMDVIASPNDQWCIDLYGDVWHLGTSAQLFAGLKHTGNINGQYFSDRVNNQIWKTSYAIAHHMRAAGYRGALGLDYIICPEGIYPIENNARLNGSTFALGIVDRLREFQPDIRCWKFFKSGTKGSTFNALKDQIGPLLFDGTRTNAVFPFDCDTLADNGTFATLLVAEDSYHIDFMERALHERGIEKI